MQPQNNGMNLNTGTGTNPLISQAMQAANPGGMTQTTPGMNPVTLPGMQPPPQMSGSPIISGQLPPTPGSPSGSPGMTQTSPGMNPVGGLPSGLPQSSPTPG